MVIADGTSRRMQKTNSNNNAKTINKSFLLLDKKTLIEHVINRSRLQVDTLIINGANNPQFKAFNLPLVPDSLFESSSSNSAIMSPDDSGKSKLGPLAGIVSAMQWALQQNNSTDSQYKWLATFPCDTPFIPTNLVSQLIPAAISNNANVACGASNERISPLCGVWSLELLPDLLKFLANGNRGVMHFLETTNYVTVNFEPADHSDIDPFYNINTQEELDEAHRRSAN